MEGKERVGNIEGKWKLGNDGKGERRDGNGAGGTGRKKEIWEGEGGKWAMGTETTRADSLTNRTLM